MNEIQINIQSSQEARGEKDHMTVTTQGVLRQEGDTSIIEYSDIEGGPEGLTTIRVQDHTVSMQKLGAIETEFVFEQGKTYATLYKLPYGDMHVTLLPTRVNAEIGEKSGSIELEYVMSIAGAQLLNRLNLNYAQR